MEQTIDILEKLGMSGVSSLIFQDRNSSVFRIQMELTLIGGGGGADSALFQIGFFIIPLGVQQNPKIL